jgi:hypothetical protein
MSLPNMNAVAKMPPRETRAEPAGLALRVLDDQIAVQVLRSVHNQLLNSELIERGSA